MHEPYVTIVGNLTADPELRFTNSGKPVCNFTLCNSPKRQDSNGNWVSENPMFVRCAVWGAHGENVAESLLKGMRVIVQGYLSHKEYQTTQGEVRQTLELRVDEVAPTLRFATARVERQTRNTSNLYEASVSRVSSQNQYPNMGGAFSGSQTGAGEFANTGFNSPVFSQDSDTPF